MKPAASQWAPFQSTSTVAASASMDFVADFHAPTNGSGDCFPAIIDWRNFLVANPGAELTIPAHVYNMTFDLLICSDPTGTIGFYPDTYILPGCTITGTGGRPLMKSWTRTGSIKSFQGDLIVNGGFIDSCSISDTTINLKSSGDASKFHVGGWVCVCGIILQSHGLPPNFQRYEYHKITNITGTAIALDGALRYDYSDTWPNSLEDGGVVCGGAACAFSMGPALGNSGNFWDNTFTISNIEFLMSDLNGDGVMNSSGVITTPPSVVGFVVSPIKELICNNCVIDAEASHPGVSFCKNFVFNSCTIGGFAPELDKCSEATIYDACTITTHLNIQSASPEFLTIRNGCVCTGLFNEANGKNCIVSDSAVGNLFNTGAGYGRQDTMTITNSTITTGTGYPDYSGHNIGTALIAALVYQGSGRFYLTSNSNDVIHAFQQAVVPGYQYAFAYQTDIFPDPQFTTPTIRFCVTDISDAPGSLAYNVYMQTDMTYVAAGTDGMDNFPTNTFNGNAWNVWQCITWKSFTIDGVDQTSVGPQFIATVDCPG